MLSFVAQRIVKGVIVLLAIIVLNFFLIRLAPGDPAMVMAGERRALVTCPAGMPRSSTITAPSVGTRPLDIVKPTSRVSGVSPE